MWNSESKVNSASRVHTHGIFLFSDSQIWVGIDSFFCFMFYRVLISSASKFGFVDSIARFSPIVGPEFPRACHLILKEYFARRCGDHHDDKVPRGSPNVYSYFKNYQ